jgi:hypothetical protein
MQMGKMPFLLIPDVFEKNCSAFIFFAGPGNLLSVGRDPVIVPVSRIKKKVFDPYKRRKIRM